MKRLPAAQDRRARGRPGASPLPQRVGVHAAGLAPLPPAGPPAEHLPALRTLRPPAQAWKHLAALEAGEQPAPGWVPRAWEAIGRILSACAPHSLYFDFQDLIPQVSGPLRICIGPPWLLSLQAGLAGSGRRL